VLDEVKDEHVWRNASSVGWVYGGEWDGPSWMERAEEDGILVEKRMDRTNLG